MRSQSIFLSLFLLPLSSPAIDNLPWNCEQVLKLESFPVPGMQFTYPNVPVTLEDDDILIRGKLERHWESASSQEKTFGVMDEFYYRKILPSRALSFYPLKSGDHLFIVAPNGKLKIHGYYNEVNSKPALFSDSKLQYEVISAKELDGYFHGPFHAILIRKMPADQKSRLAETLSPYINHYQNHLNNEDRLVKINEHFTVEVGYFEKLLHGRFLFKEAGPHFIQPLRISSESENPEKLHPDDEIFILDENRNVIHRQKFDGQFAMIQTQDTAALVDRLRTGREIYVLRRTAY